MKAKNSILIVLILTLLILNVYLFVRRQSAGKPKAYKSAKELPGIKTEEVAPEFTLKDLQGKIHTTEELKGKNTILIFRNIEDEKSFLEAYYYKLLLGKYKDRNLDDLLWNPNLTIKLIKVLKLK